MISFGKKDVNIKISWSLILQKNYFEPMPLVLLSDVSDIELVISSNFRHRSPSNTLILFKISLDGFLNLNRMDGAIDQSVRQWSMDRRFHLKTLLIQ